VVIEEFLDGPERSVFGVCDGDDVVLLQPSQDYKRALDGDEGLNTGGMGAFTPVPDFGTDRTEPLREQVFRPVLREMAARGTPFRGLLYAGLVDTADGPEAAGVQRRFGDPETQVVLPALRSDLGDLLWAAAARSATYAVDDDHLLLVASDRVSTYDVVHPTLVPDKGRVLTGLSAFWFDRLAALGPHHLVSTSLATCRWRCGPPR
jgi:phosphoribosylamine-glycine ligase